MLEHGQTCIEVFEALPIQPDNRHPRMIISYSSGFCKRVDRKMDRFFKDANFQKQE